MIYIIYLLLKQEINNLENINSENFLENTKCGMFLEQLFDKIDIKFFCKLNILNIIESLKSNFSSKRICFDVDSLDNYFKNNIKNKNFENIFIMYKEIPNNEIGKKDEINLEKNNSEDIKKFNSKYLIDIKIKNLEEYIMKYEKKNNNNMKEYIKYQVDESKKEIEIFNNENIYADKNKKIKNINEIYSNENFINHLFLCEHSKEIFSLYINLL